MELSLPSGPSAFLEIRQIENQGCDCAPTTSQTACVLRPKNLGSEDPQGSGQVSGRWREGGRQGGRQAGRRWRRQQAPSPCHLQLRPSVHLPSPVSSGTTSSKTASDLLTADSAWSPVLCGSVHLLSPLCCQEVVKTCRAAGGPPSHNNVSMSPISCL